MLQITIVCNEKNVLSSTKSVLSVMFSTEPTTIMPKQACLFQILGYIKVEVLYKHRLLLNSSHNYGDDIGLRDPHCGCGFCEQIKPCQRALVQELGCLLIKPKTKVPILTQFVYFLIKSFYRIYLKIYLKTKYCMEATILNIRTLQFIRKEMYLGIPHYFFTKCVHCEYCQMQIAYYQVNLNL